MDSLEKYYNQSMLSGGLKDLCIHCEKLNVIKTIISIQINNKLQLGPVCEKCYFSQIQAESGEIDRSQLQEVSQEVSSSVSEVAQEVKETSQEVAKEVSSYTEGLTDQGLAVYNSMKRAGHDEQTIKETIDDLGYKK